MASSEELPLETPPANGRARTRWLAVLALAALLLAGLSLLLNWQAERRERERQQLEDERLRLRAQLAVLTRRRELLLELDKLATRKDFYAVVSPIHRELHLRFQNRTVRRIAFWQPAVPPTPGRYSLLRIGWRTLDWKVLVVVRIRPASEELSPCSAVGIRDRTCLVVTPDDFDVLSRTLKPGAPLLVLH